MIVIISSTWFSRSARAGSSAKAPLSSRSAWAASAATIPLTVIAMLTVASTTRRGRRAATRSPSSSGTGSRAESRDQPGRAPRCAGGVGKREDGAGAGGADGGHEGRGDRHTECDGRHQADRGHGERRRTRAAEEAGAGIGEQRSGQPSERQPGRGGEQGDDDVLGEQHGGDQARRAADRLEQPDAPDLVGHPAADEDGDAGHGEQAEQPAAGQQSLAAGF